MLEENIKLEELIPVSFYHHFNLRFGRPRVYSLTAFIWALLIQKIFSIPTDSLLLIFLKYSKPLRDFCGFTKVPDAPKLTHFKQDFLPDLQDLFNRLVDMTEPICQKIDPWLADMNIFDTSGLEAFVTENNPKYANGIIKRMKAYKASRNLGASFDPYKAAYGSMPSHAAAQPDIKHHYINGHFCYAYKFGLVSNGLGIIRHISFYNKAFLDKHPEIVLEKKSDSPDDDKSLSDAKALIPVLKEFFEAHPLIDPKVFLGDCAFDTHEIYKALLSRDAFGPNRHFTAAYIPLNRRNTLENSDCSVTEDGIPCCPHDPKLPMKPDGTSRLKNGTVRFKFSCPKIKWRNTNGKSRRLCLCDNPCTPSRCGRMVYIYPEKDLRAFPGAVRGTQEWKDTYKIRTVVEKGINHFKNCFCVEGRKTRNDKTLHADLLLAGIAQQLTVILADNIHRLQFIRSLKPLVA